MAHTKWKEPKHAAWLSCAWLLLSFFPYPVVHSAAAPTRYCDRTFVLMPTKDSVQPDEPPCSFIKRRSAAVGCRMLSQPIKVVELAKHFLLDSRSRSRAINQLQRRGFGE